MKTEIATSLKLLLIGVWGVALTTASAENAVKPERWPLSKILNRALETSLSIKATQHEVTASENRARQAGKWDNPEFSTTLGQRSAGGGKGRALQISVLQSVPLFGQKSAAEKVGTEENAVAQVENKSQRLSTEHLVIRQAFKLSSFDEQMKHVTHRREKILLIGEYLKSRPFASPSQAVEKNLIQNRLREIEEKFIQVTAAREHEWQSLNVYLDLSETISPEINWMNNPLVPNKTVLQEKIEKESPEVVKQAKLVAVSESEIVRAGKRAYPEIKIGGGYAEESADQTEKTYFGALQFTIPIFDGGTYGVEAARAKKDAESLRFEQRRREVTSGFKQAWAELTESKKRIELYPLDLIPKLEAQMQRAEQNWRKGLVPVSAFLELENQVHEQILRVFDSQTAYVDALSSLFLLSGQSFPQEGK